MTLARETDTPGRVWIMALLLSLLLHAGAILGVRSLDLTRGAPAAVPEPAPIELVFVPSPAEEGPRTFTEIPPELETEPPERADFLSNLASRARDRRPGETEEALPASKGLAEAPHLALRPGSSAGLAETRDPLPETPEAAPPAEDQTADAREEAPAPDEISRAYAAAAAAQRARDPLAAFRRPEANPSQSPPSALGQGDYYQEAMNRPEGNVSLVGDLSLNTTAWINGFWMQRFQRAVSAKWVAPYAFELGMIHGWTYVELEVDRSGELLRLEVLAEEGHYTLGEASLKAIRDAAPFSPLPEEFPEPRFTIRLKMIYQDLARRRSGPHR